MKNIYKAAFLIASVFITVPLFAQTTLSTASLYSNNNGSGTVTFNLENTNSYDIIITDVSGVTGASGTQTAEIWYKTTPVNGAPGAISNANGWFLGASGTYTGIANTSTTTLQPFLTNINFVVPANTTWGLAITTPSQRYFSMTTNITVSGGGVNMIAGTNISYGGGTPPAAPGNSPRGWIGSITFRPGCEGPAGLTATNITAAGATLNWNAVSGSLGYEYVLDQNPGNPSGSGTFTSSTSYTASGLNLNTTYYFHVRNICNAAYSPWITYAFTTLNAYCLRPTQILFSNITGTSADAHWSLMPTTDYYQYKLDITRNAALDASNTITTTGITAQFANLTPDTWYYLYIRSFCLSGTDSSLWKIDSFYTSNFCPAPDVQIANLGSNAPVASWSAIPNAVGYEYRLTNTAATPAFGTETYNTTVNLNLPSDGTEQYLHVRTKCNSIFTFSNWSTVQLRATGVASVNLQQISVSPNPATDLINISGAKDATYTLSDISGRMLLKGNVNADLEVIYLNELSAGIYVLQLFAEYQTYTTKLVKK